MRALVEGLETPHPIGLQLPGLFQDDDFTRRFTWALDEVLAPVFVTLDAIEAYVDPWLAPGDFLLWLSEWVGIPIDHDLPEERKRALVARAADLYGWAGTAKGIADLVELYSGVRPEVLDSGAVAWSPTPDGDIPGSDDAEVTVRFPPGATIDTARVQRLLAEALPAHVVASVEVSQR
ncbi:MAG: phage tail protein [Actinobacteria bacterium]|nr:phage tail protein [Actinomycetota bacterium]MBW3649205.1 phage tail protein [Actinomycetota bacterium]